jgi:hypothetical protein
MDGIALGLFLIAAFAGGFASALAGFAMGFIVFGIWLHILTPLQTTVLIVGAAGRYLRCSAAAPRCRSSQPSSCC